MPDTVPPVGEAKLITGASVSSLTVPDGFVSVLLIVTVTLLEML